MTKEKRKHQNCMICRNGKNLSQQNIITKKQSPIYYMYINSVLMLVYSVTHLYQSYPLALYNIERHVNLLLMAMLASAGCAHATSDLTNIQIPQVVISALR